MRPLLRPIVLVLAVAALAASPATGRQLHAQQGFMATMHRDLNDTQKKLVDLANAIPESAYGWRPAPGVRSIGEVLQHIAADNYILPVYMGTPAPAATGITADYGTAVAYETRRGMTKAQIVADLEASFAHLHRAVNVNTDANITENINWFGTQATRLQGMTGTVGHLHEHLGQLIAYARSNNVKPPWSN
ncbi:DinB family protein [Pseudogemmatithrix spongiicola]|uniref:DinB family protein n=1 Tax=Pseudogemmatithrix spongiicola TaxID=3062599 RepID=A0AA49Q767_9BACT|nr:DinB family protein [Gemmatimonadaceae bacterium 'strain 138']WKW14369.1 DinB family protein [Gemmatimonadaceae bacterium 'strain 318']